MIPSERLDEAKVPGSSETLELWRHDQEYSIRVDRWELMNSRQHGSEEALAELALEAISSVESPHVLTGGLGLGYTLRAALDHSNATSTHTVAELSGAVVDWCRKYFGELANHPLDDPRVRVYEGDVGKLMASRPGTFDAILLDVDNGPEGLTRDENGALYSVDGLRKSRAAPRPGGVLGVWSASRDRGFTRKLEQAKFEVREEAVRARRTKGGRHTIWIARR